MKYSTSLIGEIIKKERKKRNWTQEKVADKINISINQISKYEKGELVPPFPTLFKLCEIFNCDLGYLLGEEDYSQGNKLYNEIYNLIGLNAESIEVLKHITGTGKRSPEYGTNPEKYKRILNALISSLYFTDFIKCIETLDYHILKFEEAQDKLNELELKRRVQSDVLNEKGFIEYHDSDIEMSQELSDAFKEFMEIIDQQESYVYPIKIARYELREIFEDMIQDIYPRKLWDYHVY